MNNKDVAGDTEQGPHSTSGLDEMDHRKSGRFGRLGYSPDVAGKARP